MEFLRWRQRARSLAERFDQLLPEAAEMGQKGRIASEKYEAMLREWNQRVDPATMQPREKCPEGPPELFLSSLPEQQRELFLAHYSLWLKGGPQKSDSAQGKREPDSGTFQRWLEFPRAPVGSLVAEQRSIDEWHARRSSLEGEIAESCEQLAMLLPTLRNSIRMIAVKESRRNRGAAESVLEAFDRVTQRLGHRPTRGPTMLKEALAEAEQVVAALWNSEYGSQLSRELATQLFQQALRTGQLRMQGPKGIRQAQLAALLDREGIPVPQHLVFAAPTWQQAFEKAGRESALRSTLSKWWSDAITPGLSPGDLL
ncbi:MAG: hypothetical protein NZR01_08110 [Bryobacteraceae bacterium]|nr:hypothetical protein [Bryobacteraceae bacterium]